MEKQKAEYKPSMVLTMKTFLYCGWVMGGWDVFFPFLSYSVVTFLYLLDQENVNKINLHIEEINIYSEKRNNRGTSCVWGSDVKGVTTYCNPEK